MRADLLALDDDALVALSNRGIVKRALAELETASVELTESDDGTITARWSDDAVCTLPPNRPLADARCTCPSPGLCRHVIRTVLAYRTHQSPPLTTVSPSLTEGGRGERSEHSGGFGTWEVLPGAKPIVRHHDSGATVRFLVPGDLNYALCDCGSTPPCEHARAALALLDEGATGLVVKGEPPPVPEVLGEGEESLRALLAVGLASAPPALQDRLRRAEDALRGAGLPWLAEILGDLALEKAAYDGGDARFDPATLSRLVGEFFLRAKTLREGTGAAPALFVGGSASDKPMKLDAARLVGLGCGVEIKRGGVRLTAYLLDEATGRICGVVRESADGAEPGETPRPFGQLAKASAAKGVSLAALGESSLLVRGVNRSAAGMLSLTRATVGVNPQGFLWEKLRGPCVVSGFAEAAARDDARPPAALRPRRLGESLIVAPVQEVTAFGFDAASQSVVARLRDPDGGEALLVHPFRSRGSAGVEALRSALAGSVRFVVGAWESGSVAPIALVVEGEDGTRRLVQPHIADDADSASMGGGMAPAISPPRAFVTDELPRLLGELLVVGIESLPTEASRWREAHRSAEALGFARIAPLLAPLAEAQSQSLERLLALLTL